MDLLKLVKQYNAIDFEDDDEILGIFIEESKDYITEFTGKSFDENNKKHKLILIALVKDLYENRGYTVKEIGKRNRHIHTLLLREQLRKEE